MIPKRTKIIPEGTRYGNWTVLSFSHIAKNKAGTACWNVRCDCGHEAVREGSSLRNKNSSKCKSCANKLGAKHRAMHHTGKDLYMMKCGPYIKIGRTSNIKSRLAGVQSACPFEVELIGFWKDYGYKEQEWHLALQHLHHKGEWFKFNNSEKGCYI